MVIKIGARGIEGVNFNGGFTQFNLNAIYNDILYKMFVSNKQVAKK